MMRPLCIVVLSYLWVFEWAFDFCLFGWASKDNWQLQEHSHIVWFGKLLSNLESDSKVHWGIEISCTHKYKELLIFKWSSKMYLFDWYHS